MALAFAEDGVASFDFGGQRIRLVRDFETEAGTVEEIGFVVADLAKALEHSNPSMLTPRLGPDQKGLSQIETLRGAQSLTVISESGFYDVVVRSDKPQGKALRAVVTREILPQLRKTGHYTARPEAPAPVAALKPAEVLDVLERSLSICERLGGIDERDAILYKDMARDVAMRAANGSVPVLPGSEELTLSDGWLEVFGRPFPPALNSQVGKLLAKAYREQHGEKPPKRLQHCGGAPRQVNSYRRGWLIQQLRELKESGFEF